MGNESIDWESKFIEAMRCIGQMQDAMIGYYNTVELALPASHRLRKILLDTFEFGRCETCVEPATTSDSEGVPFCARCAAELGDKDHRDAD